ncbi:Na+/H+ antiporter subunit C [candidate division KSB1 bacterium]|nr:Na+/H+ antiporter subunit C [candidate division KSB1 bacterium]
MVLLYAILIGVMFGAAVYLLLRRSIVKLVFGLVLLSQATNLFIFTIGGYEKNNPPLVEKGQLVPTAPYVDPLPQALILTAIVISFGVLAFTMVLMHRAHESIGTDDLHQMRDTDK